MKLPDPLKRDILDLQGRLLDLLDEVTVVERSLLMTFGETAETTDSLTDLDNIREQVQDAYRRFWILMGNIAVTP
ncbi:hypothetical protein [Gloeobacter violaceus]|uniref:Gsr1577 protein n=1 Tax=Gloeobacter violaceus (strain ATCC 29082 / PCC 7421) TaxID=251221 RepID=Q7NKA1_GLOVI|nr:hypothetical protein [Gloeobacter violaceus]BAC89518.1 gsr1577 [Gloeobacter violaceus PCC 7421]